MHAESAMLPHVCQFFQPVRRVARQRLIYLLGQLLPSNMLGVQVNTFLRQKNTLALIDSTFIRHFTAVIGISPGAPVCRPMSSEVARKDYFKCSSCELVAPYHSFGRETKLSKSMVSVESHDTRSKTAYLCHF